MMPSWCRQVNWGNCGIPWVNCAVLCERRLEKQFWGLCYCLSKLRSLELLVTQALPTVHKTHAALFSQIWSPQNRAHRKPFPSATPSWKLTPRPRSKHEKRTAGSAWETWTVCAADDVRFYPYKVRNKFPVNFWNCTILLWTHCI
jgi:hypothetical protein